METTFIKDDASSVRESSAAPVLHVSLSLTTSTFRASDADSVKPVLTVTTTLETPSILTVNAHGEWDSGTVLGTSWDKDFFRMEIFAFYDLTTSEPVVHELFPGTCEPWRDGFVELRSSRPHITQTILHEIDPCSDPVNILKLGHKYRMTLKPQKIKCWTGSIKELVEGRGPTHAEGDDAGFTMVTLACDEELVLNVEA